MGVFSVGLLGSLLGRGRPTLDYVLEHCPRRPVAATAYANQTDSPSFGLDVSRAATALDMASLLAARIAGGVDAAAVRDQFPDMLTRTRNRLESTRVAELCREALDGLMTVYGSSAFAQANPLQRIWRDVYAASRHAAFGTGIPAQMHGRALVGGEPRALSFLI
jgi:alkylation response protein AidB-like acyl-CoA dehydrogenase